MPVVLAKPVWSQHTAAGWGRTIGAAKASARRSKDAFFSNNLDEGEGLLKAVSWFLDALNTEHQRFPRCNMVAAALMMP